MKTTLLVTLVLLLSVAALAQTAVVGAPSDSPKIVASGVYRTQNAAIGSSASPILLYTHPSTSPANGALYEVRYSMWTEGNATGTVTLTVQAETGASSATYPRFSSAALDTGSINNATGTGGSPGTYSLHVAPGKNIDLWTTITGTPNYGLQYVVICYANCR